MTQNKPGSGTEPHNGYTSGTVDPPIPATRFFLPAVAAGSTPPRASSGRTAGASKLPGRVQPVPRIVKIAHMESAVARGGTARADLFSAGSLPPLEAFDLAGFQPQKVGIRVLEVLPLGFGTRDPTSGKQSKTKQSDVAP